MTLREYITENMVQFVYDSCQMQTCDNCSIGNVEACVLRRCDFYDAIDEDLTEEEEKHLCS